MSTPSISPRSGPSSRTTRRRFLAGAGAATAAIGGGTYLLNQGDRWPETSSGQVPDTSLSGNLGSGDASSGNRTDSAASPTPLASVPEGRTLVVIDLAGGNDGLATLEPYGSSRLRSIRENVMHDPEELVRIDDEMGLNPSLAGIHELGLAVVEGVGTTDGEMSHFEMENRWSYGMAATDDDFETGFFGRLCDQLDVGAPLTGLAIGTRGYAKALLAEKAVTAGLADADAGWFFRDEGPWFRQYRSSVLAMAAATGGSQLLANARNGAERAVEFADLLGGIGGDDDDNASEQERVEAYPGNELGRKLAGTARLLRADTGLRVIHLTHGGFDTHDGQVGTHDYLMTELNDSLVAFRNDLADTGLDQSTLIATTSEFGRRPKSSGSGTDHGNASVALLSGPVVPGRHGEAPSLTKLDAGDNLSPTVGMGDYYATLASWFGVDSSTVLAGTHTPIEGLLT